MSPLESRVESALTAAAAEITPADVPELRLPVARNGRGRFMTPGAPTVRRRWLAPLAAAVSVAAVVTGMVFVGRAAWNERGGTWPQSGAVSRAQRLLAKEALDSYVPATGAQYTAGLAFAWTRKKILARDVARCMAAAGFAQPAFTWSKRNFVLHFTDYGRFPDLRQRLRIRSTTPATGAGKQSTFVPTRQRPAYAAASQRCLASHAGQIARLERASALLAASWMAEVGRIQSSAAVKAQLATFTGCLEAAGVPARYAKTGGSHGSELFGGYFAWMNALGRTPAGRVQLPRTQRTWAPVFVTCARPAVGTMERLQIAAKRKFLLAHAGQIGTIRRIVIGLVSARRQ